MTRTKIIEFLRKNHKHADRFDENCIDAWERAWRNSAEEGYAHIEIESYNSNTGAPIILDEEK